MFLFFQSESVDLIYCDILYGTGRNFGDYQDLNADRKAIEDFYLPRIKEMHRVLKSTGSIYLQMDTRINHWLRCIMDNVFGYNNFLNEIIWAYSWGARTDSGWNKKHDVILLFSKSNKFTFNAESVKVNRNIKENTINRMKYAGAMIKDNLTYPTDVWDIPTINGMAKERTKYATQKPKELLMRVITASSNEGDVVAYFFLGMIIVSYGQVAQNGTSTTNKEFS